MSSYFFYEDGGKEDYDSLSDEDKIKYRETFKEIWLKRFTKNLDKIFDNAVSISKIGVLNITEPRFTPIFFEAETCYAFGYSLPTIALCAIASERLCMDLILKSKIELDGKILTEKEKEVLSDLNQSKMIELLKSWNIINEETEKSLWKINTTRIKYIHPKNVPKVNPEEFDFTDVKDEKAMKEDAKKTLIQFKTVLREIFGIKR